MTQEQKAILYDWYNEYRSDGETLDDLVQTLDERHSELVTLLQDPKSIEDDSDGNYISDNKACELIEEALKAEVVV